jgi:RES domain-containing protein
MGPRSVAPASGPPSDLHERPLRLQTTSQVWVRLHHRRYKAKYFGGARRHRFDAPNGEFGVLYAGQDEACAFIEVFGDPLDVRILSLHVLTQYCFADARATRPLRLVDLTGAGLRQFGADVRLTGGDDYDYSRKWALGFWGHPDKPDGILYLSRHDPSLQAVAIFDRTGPVIRTKRRRCLGDDRTALGYLLDRYGFGLVD